MSEQETFTPNELAEEMGISPKNLRSFMRTLTDDRAGKGNRWILDRETCDMIIARYAETNRTKVTFRITK